MSAGGKQIVCSRFLLPRDLYGSIGEQSLPGRSGRCILEALRLLSGTEPRTPSPRLHDDTLTGRKVSMYLRRTGRNRRAVTAVPDVDAGRAGP